MKFLSLCYTIYVSKKRLLFYVLFCIECRSAFFIFYIWRVNYKWYIAVFVIALTFFGVGLEQSALPNQEIVVQFNSDNISASEKKEAIVNITSQLKSIGVTDILVSDLQDGKLRVSYYSSKDVSAVKSLFNKQEKIGFKETAFNDKEFPSEPPFGKNTVFYKLDIVKIQKDYDSTLGLQGLPVVVKSVKDQYIKPVLTVSASEINFSLKQILENVAFKNYRDVSFSLNSTSYKIPEVRAGPLS